MRIKNSTSGESSLVYCNTKVKDIKYAFSKLNGNKNDGKRGTNSNQFIYATTRFICIFSLLLQCMLVHGYNADELQNSVIYTRDNLNNSNNYRGIALGSALCKVIDHWIIGQCNDKL